MPEILFGRFEIQREIRKGGSATVYLVNDLYPGTGEDSLVALKVFNKSSSHYKNHLQPGRLGVDSLLVRKGVVRGL